ncbi:MAG: glycosyltransferase family 2 protein [Lachnospiraceae bacterium]|nr:glycosyltransferase family 2 protein [Lachnospiraceae bacterium]
MITISLCMIVKNEERVLARCLDSIKELMDEIIIVDTGSTDRTKEIARKYTDKIYDFVWNDDFSEVRNYSFSKANMEYIYVADADEVLDEENRKRFYQLKKVLLPEIDIVQMYYCNQLKYNTTYNFDKEYRPKLYKRIREFRWHDPIHESVRLEPMVFDSDISILHLPEENHGSRDFSVFQKIWKRGEVFNKKMLQMYARELFITGEEKDFVEAKGVFHEIFKEEDRDLEEIKAASLVLARGYHIENQVSEFFKYIMKDMVTEPSSEGCYELGTFYLEQKDYEEACNWFINAIEGSEAYLNILYQKELPLVRLMDCYEILEKNAIKIGNHNLAEQYKTVRENLLEKYSNDLE